MKSFKDILPLDRPREKLVEKGPESLSDIELIAVILGSGVKGKDVFQIARSLSRKLNNHRQKIDMQILRSIKGIGVARACTIIAAFELVRRQLIVKEGITIHRSEDLLPLIAPIANEKQEHLLCITLNGANQVIGHQVVTIGLLNKNQIHPREVFANAIAERAAAIILAHNHPSGILTPSKDDITATRRMVEAGQILGINVLDHIIISPKGFLSLKSLALEIPWQ